MVFHTAFHVLNYLPFPPVEEEVTYITERAFLDRGMHDFSKAELNQYELKQFLVTCLGTCKPLCSLLGIAPRELYGSYQRNKMSVIMLNQKGLVNMSTCRYRYHYSLIQYKPLLHPEHVASIHDLALGMGANDPLRSDYTKFTKKAKKASDSYVVPLDTGHLTNLMYHSNKIRQESAIVIQTMARAYIQRRQAEFEAKRRAFSSAKQLAMQEMKEKVLNEFKRREASEGTAKMKWDAQVRMRQAKLRSSGTNLSRADVVMVMMEEAITRSREEIEARFRKLEEEEGLDPVVEEDEVSETPEEDTTGDMTFSLFGLIKKKAGTEDILKEDAEDVGTPREDDDDAPPAEDVYRNEAEIEQLKLEQNRSRQMILGKYIYDPEAKGETFNETIFRFAMMNPEPTYEHLWIRLKSVDKNMTDVKLRELLSEVPSKRLLMLYLKQIARPELEEELRSHYRIARNQSYIADVLKCICETDLETGYLKKFLDSYTDVAEGGLRALVSDDISKSISEIEYMVEKRFHGAEGRIPELDIVKAELDRVSAHYKRFRTSSIEIERTISQLRLRYKKISLSVGEMAKKQFVVQSIYDSKLGVPQARIPITSEHRHNWMRRVNTALRRPANTLQEAEIKFGEIRCVCKEFLEYATHDAMVIIQEHFQPKEFRSTPILSEKYVRGRSSALGRGVDGKSYTYEAHNIIYTVCLDYNGVFDGSDEFSLKAGGFERLGSVEYFKCHTPRLNIPIVATIDYFGFRVIAVSKLPTETILFTDEGEVKKIKEEQLHGMKDDGDRFVNKSKTVFNLLRQTAQKLNLAEHGCRGMQDMSGTKTYCSSEIKIYKASDDEFYMKDFWRAFPAEDPGETPYFTPTPRGQSVFWRQLRPEFVRRYEKPLSPDAICAAAYGQPDEKEHYDNAKDATKYLVQHVIPRYTETLCNREYTQALADGLGVDLTTELHDQGIGIRHLGYIRGLMWRKLPGTFNIFFNERFIRTSVDLRGEVTNGMFIRLAGVMYTVTETDKRKVTHNRIPIGTLFTGLSLRNQEAFAGHMKTEKNCDDIRSVLLAEMVARTLKNLLRMQLREYAKVEKGISTDFKRSLLCKMFNVATGSDPESNELLMTPVYEGIRSRFGVMSVLPSERDLLQKAIVPCCIYIIRRLQKMTGSQLSAQCITEFHEHPESFHFVPMDFLSVAPIVKHNMPALSFADAMLASMYASEGEKHTYTAEVLADQPPLFFLLNERNGTRTAENKGVLGQEYNAKYSSGCVFEQPGPVYPDPYIRAVAFEPERLSRVETRYHSSAVPRHSSTHFTVEAFAKCTGGESYNRVVCMNGRYGISVTRENDWSFIMREGGLHEISIKIAPVEMNKWTHIVGTYDGTSLRCYVNSWLTTQVEVEVPLRERMDEYFETFEKKRKELKNLEVAERESIKATAKKQCEDYFVTKDGISAMKTAARHLMNSKEFQAEAIGEQSGSRDAAINKKKAEALKRVKHKYATDVYVNAVQQCTERFKEMYDELEDRKKREIEESEHNGKKPLRIGASVTTLASKHGKSYFYGHISCVAVYNKCLSLDRIRAHFVASQANAAKDAPRLHAVAARLYEQALLFAGDDPMLLRNYAKSLCQYLRVENTTTTEFAIARGKAKIKNAIDDFKNRMLPLGIAEIIMALPVEYRFADLVCHGFLAIRQIDSQFFASSVGVTRKDLVQLPRKFGLEIPDSPEVYTEAAAGIYKEVTKDYDCAEVYGDINMSWINDLKSHHLTTALVSQLAEDSECRSVVISQLYQACPKNIPTLHDDDVKVMCSNMRLLVVVDLSRCTRITDASIAALATLRSLRVLTLDGCEHISDDGMEELVACKESLEVLSIAGVQSITDEGLGYIGRQCRLLTSINVNNCSQVSAEGLVSIARGCKKLICMLASATHINDAGIAAISALLSKKYMDTIDISFCRDISDHGIVTLVDQCPNLSTLNICGLNRVTEIGTNAICSNCWKIAHLNMEDVFLLDDDSFYFDHIQDGRKAADENMLKALVTLNLKDCVHITDRTLQGLQQRCAHIETLILQGCHKLTDVSLAAMYEAVNDTCNNLFPMCDSFRSLNLASCLHFTAPALTKLFSKCGMLENLDLSGVNAVNDALIEELCQLCPTIQSLSLSRCTFISDNCLCCIASNLWLEHLDISYCNKITDCGIEVLSTACNGLVTLACKRLRRLTNRSVNILLRNCKLMKRLDISECGNVNLEAFEEFTKGYQNVHVIT